MIKDTLAILNVQALNDRVAEYVKQKLIELKEEKDKSTITVEILTLLSREYLRNIQQTAKHQGYR